MSESDDRTFVDLINDILPPDGEITLKGVDGTEYKLPGAVPGRRQIKTLRALESLLSLPAVTDSIDKGRAAWTSEDWAGVLSAAAKAIGDDALADALDEAFLAAYPDVLGEGVQPMDVLGLEEVVESFLPFFGQIVRKLAKMSQSVES